MKRVIDGVSNTAAERETEAESQRQFGSSSRVEMVNEPFPGIS